MMVVHDLRSDFEQPPFLELDNRYFALSPESSLLVFRPSARHPRSKNQITCPTVKASPEEEGPQTMISHFPKPQSQR